MKERAKIGSATNFRNINKVAEDRNSQIRKSKEAGTTIQCERQIEEQRAPEELECLVRESNHASGNAISDQPAIASRYPNG
jgi:hypothetical protein